MPQHESRNTAPVNRPARDQAARWIRQWLLGDITGVELEQALDVLSIRSRDSTLRSVCRIMEVYGGNHFNDGVGLDKVAWHHVQRLLLVLASDWHLKEQNRNGPFPGPGSWVMLASFAAALLLSLVTSLYLSGTGGTLAVLWFASGIIVAGFMPLWMPALMTGTGRHHPFSAGKQMQQVLRDTPRFRFEPAPEVLRQADEQESLISRINRRLFPVALCLVAAPFILLLFFAVRSYEGTTAYVVSRLSAGE